MHVYAVRIYYEDTDHSGVVYHANYLKYFERAREHLLGPDELVRLLDEEGVGFVVYKASLTYRAGAAFGDMVEIRTAPRLVSDFRVAFTQNAHRQSDGELLVEGELDLVCVDSSKQLVKLPASVTGQL